MLRVSAFSLLFLFVVFVAGQGGMYIHLAEGERRCFIQEVPKDTLMRGRYEAAVLEDPQGVGINGLGITLTVQDPAGDVVLSRTAGLQGGFTFTSSAGGEHLLCFTTNTSRWFGAHRKLRFRFELLTGADAVDWNEVAKAEHLSQIEVYVRQVHDRSSAIRSEQLYMKQREAEFRDHSELMNARVAWLSVLQIVILLLTGVYTIWHLKRFFKSKKLV
jgi:hypothetical protein